VPQDEFQIPFALMAVVRDPNSGYIYLSGNFSAVFQIDI
jgi:hypothetical protein